MGIEPPTQEVVEAAQTTDSLVEKAVIVLAIAVLAPILEEMLFRGVLQPALAHWTTPALGLVMASLLFGLAHCLSKLYFLLATCVGLYFGWMAQEYNEIVAPAVAHGLYDFIALVYVLRKRH